MSSFFLPESLCGRTMDPYSDLITKFSWIDRCSIPIGMFIYHSIPLLYVQSHLNFEKVMTLFNQHCVKLFLSISYLILYLRSLFFLVFCKDLPVKLEHTVINPFFIVCITNISRKTSDRKRVESRTLERGGGRGGGRGGHFL